MSDSKTMLDMVTAINDHWNVQIPKNGETEGGNFQFVLYAYPMSCASGSEVNDYYLLDIKADLRFPLNGTLKIDSYSIICQPVDSSGKPITHYELLADSPQSTEANQTITLGVETTISGSFGFSGESPTGSIGGSVAASRSTSWTVPDLRITNNCRDSRISGNCGRWDYSLSESSSGQAGNISVEQEMLYLVPRTQDGSVFAFATTLIIYVSDHDGRHGTHWFDCFYGDTKPTIPNLDQFTYTNDRIGFIQLKPRLSAIPQPPLPIGTWAA